MTSNPYEPPQGVCDQPVKQTFPWKWLFVGGILTSLLCYLAIVAIILKDETPTGIRYSQLSFVAALAFAGLLVIGAAVAVSGGIGWLGSWISSNWWRSPP